MDESVAREEDKVKSQLSGRLDAFEKECDEMMDAMRDQIRAKKAALQQQVRDIDLRAAIVPHVMGKRGDLKAHVENVAEQLQKLQESVGKLMEQDEEITFEVSGQIFNEKRSLLCKHGGSKLAKLFGPELSSLPLNECDQPYIERSSKAFRLMIDFLKSDVKVMPSNEHLRNLLSKELEYFGLADISFNPQDELKSKLSFEQKVQEKEEKK